MRREDGACTYNLTHKWPPKELMVLKRREEGKQNIFQEEDAGELANGRVRVNVIITVVERE